MHVIINMMRHFLICFFLLCTPICAWAQDVYPSVDPKASYITVDGEEIEDASESQNAPLVAHFTANPSDVGEWSARYEWKIFRPGEENTPLVHRFEENLEYTFAESGTFHIQLYATFILGNDTIPYPQEGESNPFVVNISESKLIFPNAFSPNEVPDDFNDTLKPKEYQSIVDFKAAVFSRWGQRIYSWDNVEGEWDGRWNGHLVKDGVYFLVVHAKGADGKKYNIRKTITVITGYNKDSQGGGDEQ